MTTNIARRLKSLGHIARLVNTGSELSEVLNQITVAVCHRSIWSSSSITAIDYETGYSVLRARHDPYFKQPFTPQEQWILKTSPSRKVIETGQPVIMADAQQSAEFPDYQKEARERDYHSVVLVPLQALDEKGRSMVMAVQAHAIHFVDEDELAFLQTAAQLTSLALEKARRLQIEHQHTVELRRSIEVHTATMEHVLSGETVTSVIDHIAATLRHPFLVIDLATNQVIPRRSPKPDSMSDLDWERIVSQANIREFRHLMDMAQTSHFSKREYIDFSAIGGPDKVEVSIEPVNVDNVTLGYIAILTDSIEISMYDTLLADEARLALAVMFMREHVRLSTRVETHGELFKRLFQEERTDFVEIIERGRQLGLPLEDPARLIVLALSNYEMKALTPSSRADVLRKLLRHCSTYTAGTSAFIDDDSFVVFLPEKSDAMLSIETLAKRLHDEMLWTTSAKVVVATSDLCRQLEDYRPARKKCAELVAIAKRLGVEGYVRKDDFGPLAQLLSATNQDALKSYIADILGSIEDYDKKHKSKLLHTSEVFIKENCRYQSCANALGIHVSTLRYRLDKLNTMFGFDLRVPETRLRLEVALRARVIVPPPT